MTLEETIRQAVREEVRGALDGLRADPPGLMDAAAATRYLSLGRSSLMRRSANGEIPSRLIDGRRYWSRADLDNWILSLPVGSPLRRRQKGA